MMFGALWEVKVVVAFVSLVEARTSDRDPSMIRLEAPHARACVENKGPPK